MRDKATGLTYAIIKLMELDKLIATKIKSNSEIKHFFRWNIEELSKLN